MYDLCAETLGRCLIWRLETLRNIIDSGESFLKKLPPAFQRTFEKKKITM
jgi:hypothetical protein